MPDLIQHSWKTPELVSPVLKTRPPLFAFRIPPMTPPAKSKFLSARMYDRDGKIHARAVRQKKDKNHKPVKITEDRTIALSQKLPEQIKSLFTHPDFWKPLNENEKGMSGFDGATWIFELKDKTGYHLLDLWSPEYKRPSDEILRQAGFDPAQLRDYRPYVQAGDQLLKLMKLEREELVPD